MSDDYKLDQMHQTLTLGARAVDQYYEEVKYREDLDPVPPRIAALPVFRQYPVPAFTAKVNGVYDFRVADPEFRMNCHRFRLCWICGQKCGRLVTFVVGPLATINRISGDPSSHLECSQWASRNCPFLAKPQAKRREDAIMEQMVIGGTAIQMKPSCHALWTCKNYKPLKAGDGYIYQLSEPETLTWHTERRTATRAEVEASIEAGLPELWAIAKAEGEEAEKELALYIEDAKRFLPVD